MPFAKSSFVPFSADAQRVVANLEQAYQIWLEARRDLEAQPISMYWARRDEREYLYVKHVTLDSGTSLGPRDVDTEAQYANFLAAKQNSKARATKADELIAERAGLYRRLRLPSLPDRQAEILRKLDVTQLLGNDLMVVGTNAFVAYEQFLGARLPTGNEETEDFDLAWCRGSKVSLAAALNTATPTTTTLLGVLKSIDSSYRLSRQRPYQAIAGDGYEVELLAAPSRHPLPRDQGFDPMASLVEQEWLLLGRAIAVVVATQRGRASPLVVPDPRFMALHKLWLADKPERRADKREKDRRQGQVLLDGVRHFALAAYPLDVDFVMSLPTELLPVFDAWCAEGRFVPQT